MRKYTINEIMRLCGDNESAKRRLCIHVDTLKFLPEYSLYAEAYKRAQDSGLIRTNVREDSGLFGADGNWGHPPRWHWISIYAIEKTGVDFPGQYYLHHIGSGDHPPLSVREVVEIVGFVEKRFNGTNMVPVYPKP